MRRPSRGRRRHRRAAPPRRRRARRGGARRDVPVVDPSTGARDRRGRRRHRTRTWSARSRRRRARLRQHGLVDRLASSAPACLRQLQEALRDEAETLRRDLVAEIGCAVRMTYGDQLDRPIEKLGFYADLAERYAYDDPARRRRRPARSWLVREPLGVVGAITPWNIPVELSLAKVGAALAAGCTVVLKPSPLSPWSATHLGRLVAERTEIPAGVFNVVSSSSNDVAALLTTDPRVDAVAFTGSTATGKAVMAAAAGTVKQRAPRARRQVGERDPRRRRPRGDRAARGRRSSASTPGQSCILPSRLLVPRRELDRCVELAAEGLRDGARSATRPTPTSSWARSSAREQLDRVEGYVETRQGDGARLVAGGRARRGSRDRLLLRADALRRRRTAEPARAGGDLRARALA